MIRALVATNVPAVHVICPPLRTSRFESKNANAVSCGKCTVLFVPSANRRTDPSTSFCTFGAEMRPPANASRECSQMFTGFPFNLVSAGNSSRLPAPVTCHNCPQQPLMSSKLSTLGRVSTVLLFRISAAPSTLVNADNVKLCPVNRLSPPRASVVICDNGIDPPAFTVMTTRSQSVSAGHVTVPPPPASNKSSPVLSFSNTTSAGALTTLLLPVALRRSAEALIRTRFVNSILPPLLACTNVRQALTGFPAKFVSAGKFSRLPDPVAIISVPQHPAVSA